MALTAQMQAALYYARKNRNRRRSTRAAATGLLTVTGADNAANNETVTVGSKVYTFKTAPSAVADGQVLVGADKAESLDNLAAAINADGHPQAVLTVAVVTTEDFAPGERVVIDGVEYVAGADFAVGVDANATLANLAAAVDQAFVTAVANGDNTLTVTQASIGRAAVTTDAAHASWSSPTTLQAKYSDATTKNRLVVADRATSPMKVTALRADAGSDGIASTETMAHGSWGHATLTGGTGR